MSFYVQAHRLEKPKQAYPTKEELATLILNGNDSEHNSLVIDFDGKAHLIPLKGRMPNSLTGYAVRFETFGAENGYVGTEKSLNHLDHTYQCLLEGWLDHLVYGSTSYRDYSENEFTVEELLKQIENEINKYN
uniref:Protein kinase n=1 Tax=Anaerobacillus isosaccharinicus TaxID=1532552 RepID=A0A1S2L149_9BACI|nr:protein kinase [Anaerobacillus isosaccharinicus]QOY38534.1 protein kinase [Anaerobacillus isosaccharinicus]